MIQGFNHITIAVRDLERSFAFYKDVLQFKPLLKHSKGAYFLAGESWFCLDLDPTTRTSPLPEYTHFAFSISQAEFAQFEKQIVDSGVKKWKENKSEGDSIYFLDPDGHKLELHVGNWQSRMASVQARPWNNTIEFFDPSLVNAQKKTHQFDLDMLPDDFFVAGELKFAIPGNECRLLDQRRTPGRIVELDMTSGFFKWEITAFEDSGKHWEVPFEDISRFQFNKTANCLSDEDVGQLNERIRILDKLIEIKTDQTVRSATLVELNVIEANARKWLENRSQFLKSQCGLNFGTLEGPDLLRQDLKSYMAENGLTEMETKTTEIQVLNPYSGEWIKGMQIIMAELGIKPYFGKQVRAANVFQGLGSKESRTRYILHRLSFVRAMFKLFGHNEVPLCRGMSSEWSWQPEASSNRRFWTSWTFSQKVAQDFSDFSSSGSTKHSYLIKRSIPVEKLFMTYFETDAMNRQYKEAEALVLHEEEDQRLW